MGRGTVRSYTPTQPRLDNWKEGERPSKFLPEDFDRVLSFDPSKIDEDESLRAAPVGGGEIEGDRQTEVDYERDYLDSLDERERDTDGMDDKEFFDDSIFEAPDNNPGSLPPYYASEKFSHLTPSQIQSLMAADSEAITTVTDPKRGADGWPLDTYDEESKPDKDDPRLRDRENENAWMEHQIALDDAEERAMPPKTPKGEDFGLASAYFEPPKVPTESGNYRFSDLPPTPTDLETPGFQNRKNAIKIDPSEMRHTNLQFLQRFVGGNGNILSRRVTGLSAKDQRKVAKLIKRARHMGLIPHVGGWSVKESGVYLLGKTAHAQGMTGDIEKEGKV